MSNKISSNKKEKKIAIDFGNSFVKLMMENLDSPIVIPNIFLKAQSSEVKFQQRNTLDSLWIKYKEQEYYIGSFCKRVNRIIDERPIGKTKVDDLNSDITMLTLIAAHVKNGDKIRLSVGLPFSQYKGSQKKELQKRLIGEHTIEFVFLKSSITFEISQVDINIEGLDAAVECLSENDKYVLSMENNTKIIVIDAGSFNHSVIILDIKKDNDEIFVDYVTDNDLLISLTSGIAYAQNKLCNYLSDYEQTSVDRYDIHNCLLENKGILKSGRTLKKIDISKMFNIYLEELAKVISTDLIDRFKASNITSEINGIIMCGGGAATLKYPDYIKKYLAEPLGVNFYNYKKQPWLINVKQYFENMNEV